jgi:hypothetical protein
MSERYPDLWFADGTVILRAKDELFRVYGGILAAQSPVFADMFAVPQPEGGEKIEGCPVVDLHDDVRDLKHFLRALHDARCVDHTSSLWCLMKNHQLLYSTVPDGRGCHLRRASSCHEVSIHVLPHARHFTAVSSLPSDFAGFAGPTHRVGRSFLSV